MLCAPSVLLAQAVTDTKVRSALDLIRGDNEWTLAQQQSVCEIPAPPFKEQVRAAEVRRRFVALGLTNVHIDSIGNVIGVHAGSGPGPTVAIAGHLDTVFPEGTNVKVTRTGTLMKGPGIGDDCRGLAVLLQMVKSMRAAKVTHPGTLLIIANVGEEGPGNLRGMRYLFRKPPMPIDYFITVDGTGLGLTTRGVGSNRYRVSYEGPGGHSYGAFGMPSPIHAMGRAIAKISEMQVPKTPKTTFNVGIVSGGTSVNTISPLGQMEVDLRSESAEELARSDAFLRKAIADALADENARWPDSKVKITVKIEDMGQRPATAGPDTSVIARTAISAGKALGFAAETGAGSTDANWPMSLGIPAVSMDGGGRGEGAHSKAESYDDGTQGWLGPQWALLTVLGLLGGGSPTWRP